MELKVPFTCPYFPALGAPSYFMDAGQSYTNDCVLVPDPGSPTHKPGYVAVLNESTHKVVLLISSIPGYSVNASQLGVVGAFGRDVRSGAQRLIQGFQRVVEGSCPALCAFKRAATSELTPIYLRSGLSMLRRM